MVGTWTRDCSYHVGFPVSKTLHGRNAAIEGFRVNICHTSYVDEIVESQSTRPFRFLRFEKIDIKAQMPRCDHGLNMWRMMFKSLSVCLLRMMDLIVFDNCGGWNRPGNHRIVCSKMFNLVNLIGWLNLLIVSLSLSLSKGIGQGLGLFWFALGWPWIQIKVSEGFCNRCAYSGRLCWLVRVRFR